MGTIKEGLPPTPRQRDTLMWLHNLTQEEEGMPPTMREIGARMGIHHVTVKNHLDKLVRKGLVANHGNLARCCEVTPCGKRFIKKHAKLHRKA